MKKIGAFVLSLGLTQTIL